MLVVVGRIGRAHGIRGEVNVDIRTDEPERRLAPGSSVVCGDRILTVDTSRPHSGRLVVRFTEIIDRTAAETLHGRTLEVEIDPLDTPEDPEEFYDHQLVGLEAHTVDRVIGVVTAVLHLPEQDLLSIDADGRELLIPFVTELVPEVDLVAGRLLVADVPGLLDPEAAQRSD